MIPYDPDARSSLFARLIPNGAQLGAAGPDDELADPACAVLVTVGILRREPLVVVVVAVDDEVRAGRRTGRARTARPSGRCRGPRS